MTDTEISALLTQVLDLLAQNDHDYVLHTRPQEARKIRIWSYLAEDGNWQLDDR